MLWLTKGLGRGGAERLLVGAARYVDRERFDIEVAYLLPWKDAFVADLRSQHIPVHCVDARHIADPRWMIRLRHLITSGRFDIVHTHMPLPAIIARLLVKGSDPVIVHTEHNLWPRYRPLTRWANALTYRRNDAVMAVSNAVAASIRRPRRRPEVWPPIEVVWHGADLHQVRRDSRARSDARARLGVPERSFVVGSVGNFTPKKDHETLIAAAAILCRASPEVRLVLVGSGPREAVLRDVVSRFDLDARVTFAGSRDDVFDLLPGFDVFALSSRHEGLPIALLEAMASGVPCVATSVGGIPEVITDGQDGLLVPPADPIALGQGLARLLADSKLRQDIGSAASERATAFDLERALHRTQALYDRALAAR